MQIIELSRSYCRKEYGGDFAAMIQSRDGLIYDDERIRRGFGCAYLKICSQKQDFRSVISVAMLRKTKPHRQVNRRGFLYIRKILVYNQNNKSIKLYKIERKANHGQ